MPQRYSHDREPHTKFRVPAFAKRPIDGSTQIIPTMAVERDPILSCPPVPLDFGLFEKCQQVSRVASHRRQIFADFSKTLACKAACAIKEAVEPASIMMADGQQRSDCEALQPNCDIFGRAKMATPR